jgi:transcriptional repressor NrdR
VSTEQIDSVIAFVEDKARSKGKEITSETIGQMVSKELKKVDKVAYIRFASVYKDFTEIDDFKKEIREILKK